MRNKVTIERLKTLMIRLAQEAEGPGSIFFAGGTTALLLGIREQTIDVDLKLDPEPKGIFEAIAKLKDELSINIELASPDDFIPAPSDWREKSILIESIKGVQYFHFDLSLQALSKIERGHSQDLTDVRAFLNTGMISSEQLLHRFLELKPRFIRFPAINPKDFENRLNLFLKGGA